MHEKKYDDCCESDKISKRHMATVVNTTIIKALPLVQRIVHAAGLTKQFTQV